MKMQLYATPALSGANAIIRRLDGEYTLVSTLAAVGHLENYYETAQGRPCSREWARHVDKVPLLMQRPEGNAFNRMMYGVRDEIEIYPDPVTR